VCSAVCRSEDEAHIRTLLLYGVSNAAMTLWALDSADLDGNNKVEVQANLIMADRNDTLLEQVIKPIESRTWRERGKLEGRRQWRASEPPRE